MVKRLITIEVKHFIECITYLLSYKSKFYLTIKCLITKCKFRIPYNIVNIWIVLFVTHILS